MIKFSTLSSNSSKGSQALSNNSNLLSKGAQTASTYTSRRTVYVTRSISSPTGTALRTASVVPRVPSGTSSSPYHAPQSSSTSIRAMRSTSPVYGLVDTSVPGKSSQSQTTATRLSNQVATKESARVLTLQFSLSSLAGSLNPFTFRKSSATYVNISSVANISSSILPSVVVSPTLDTSRGSTSKGILQIVALTTGITLGSIEKTKLYLGTSLVPGSQSLSNLHILSNEVSTSMAHSQISGDISKKLTQIRSSGVLQFGTSSQIPSPLSATGNIRSSGLSPYALSTDTIIAKASNNLGYTSQRFLQPVITFETSTIANSSLFPNSMVLGNSPSSFKSSGFSGMTDESNEFATFSNPSTESVLPPTSIPAFKL